MEHNRISVIPKISSNLIFKSTEPFSGIGIINDGLGPAIIKDIELFSENIKLKKPSILAQQILLNENNLENRILLAPVNIGAIIKVDKPLWLFKTKINTRENVEKLYQMYKNTSIYLCYCSLYKECQKKVINGEGLNVSKYICHW